MKNISARSCTLILIVFAVLLPGLCPALTQTARTQTARTQTARTQPTRTQTVRTQTAQTQSARTQPTRTQTAWTQPTRTQTAQTQLARTQTVPMPAPAATVYTPTDSDSTTGLFSIGPRFGTTGLGADLAFPLGESTRLRFIGSVGTFSYTGDMSDIEYQMDLRTPTLGGVLDWHPGGGAFRLSIGGFYSGIEATGSARPTDTVSIGDGEFSPYQVGVLDATLKYPAGMGYVGFGFGDSFKGNRWTVSLDVGALLGPSPDFTLVSRDGALSNEPAFQAEVAREEQQVRDDVTDALQFYPVITLGLSFRF